MLNGVVGGVQFCPDCVALSVVSMFELIAVDVIAVELIAVELGTVELDAAELFVIVLIVVELFVVVLTRCSRVDFRGTRSVISKEGKQKKIDNQR